MLKFIEKPGLPENRVAVSLVSSEYTQIHTKLAKIFGIETVLVKKNAFLSDDISTHPDCVFVQLNADTAIIDKNSKYIVKKLTNYSDCLNVIESDGVVMSPYPNDIGLNVTVINGKILCNSKFIDNNIKLYADNLGFDIIHCNQGYSACSTIVLNNNALITDDTTIHSSAVKNGIDSILISKGSVKLLYRDYGFIGGTCGMIDKNLLAFTGKLNSHPDFELIRAFLYKYNINYIELTEGPLIDIGGIIPVYEHC